MLEVKEADLPAIGKKFTIETAAEETIVVIIRLTGEREVYRFLKGKEEPESVTTLTEEEARTIGNILAGAYFEPVHEKAVELVMKQLSMEWIKVEEDSPLANKTIGEVGIRKKTGVSVISILRDAKYIPNPLPSEAMHVGDTLVVLGSSEQMKKFLSFIGKSRE
ncbi:MAG TPA: cation:proton antiporter regulatory subunit [Candidatus Tripitaka californicus]|uniref:cation:proton antiporter regulatory subunit n=1 Tax=Candidatus Tripitaka californicus TaxID=3367616 RepID=UPI00402907F1|nr:cation:proton antiporter regulatory subunit [Planctomycetota bacterium]